MKSRLCPTLCLLALTGLALTGLVLAPPARDALCAQPRADSGTAVAEQPTRYKQAAKAAAKAATKAAGKAPTKATGKAKATATAARKPDSKAAPKAPAKSQDQGKLTAEDLRAPYAAMGGADNATRLSFDPTPTSRPFAPPAEDLPLNLHLGREQVLDPITGKEVTPRADPAGAKEDLKNLRLKGAMDKLGGKAEVQVDILKF